MKKVKRVNVKVAEYTPKELDYEFAHTAAGEIKIQLENEFKRVYDVDVAIDVDDIAAQDDRMQARFYVYFDTEEYGYENADIYKFTFSTSSWYQDENDLYEDLQEEESRFVDSVVDEY